MGDIAAFQQRNFTVSDSAVLHYAEGPAHGHPLVLVPAQNMPWESYAKVLPALSREFHCFALDVRGHGRSSHTPGEYRFSRLGEDLVMFLREIVKRPALLTGNSSGGIIAAYAAAHAPELVSGALMEDPPLFSSEWPALQSGYAYRIFDSVVRHIERPQRDVAAFFSELDVPCQDGKRVMKLPRWVARIIGWLVARHQRRFPGAPVDLPYLPFQLRLFVRSLSEFDPAFTRAFWDGSACDIDHAQILRAIRCPTLLLRANSFVHERFGLVGAMSDADVARVLTALPGCRYVDERCGHIVHQERPRRFVTLLREFSKTLKAEPFAMQREA